MRTRLLQVSAVLLVVLGAPPVAAAAPEPYIVDPVGDHRGTGDYDIVSVDLAATSARGALVDLVITFTLATEPPTTGVSSYVFGASAKGCGTFYLYTYTSALAAGARRSVLKIYDCLGDAAGETTAYPSLAVRGRSLVHRIPFAKMPPEIRRTVLRGMYAFTAPAEPVLGFTAADVEPSATAFDYATSDKSFRPSG
ncbi:MAG TPA: hypothetical protein VNB94_05750 [Mycobacteriales bacterium]|nr:hypothetical protein [Mycobacteriales bacterium]